MGGAAPVKRDSLWFRAAGAAVVVLLAAVRFYTPPAQAAELEIVPDSVEYAVAADNFAHTGRYEIVVNGRHLPSRYPPGFSVLFLAPIHALFPGNIGVGVYVVWISGVAAVLLAYLIAERMAGIFGGLLAGLLLLHHAHFVAYTQVVMTDVPAAMLGLWACWIYLRIASRPRPRTAAYFLAGVVVAVSLSIRPLTGLLVLPFAFDIVWRHRRRAIPLLVTLAMPCAVAVLATSWQQQKAFGDFRRTGYQYWLAVPYDYTALTLSPRYLRDNLALAQSPMIWAPMLLGAMGLILLHRKATRGGGALAAFVLLAAAPISVFYSFYFFRDIRFHFLLLSLGLTLAGAGAATLIRPLIQRRLMFALPALLLLALLPKPPAHALEETAPIRDRIASAADRLLPPGALLISDVDPVYLEHRLTRIPSRRVLALSRQAPYANAILVSRRIPAPSPAPKNASDHACAGLLNGGGVRLYDRVAVEEFADLHARIAAGVPIFLDTLSAPAADAATLSFRASFNSSPASTSEPWLLRLGNRAVPATPATPIDAP